MFTFAFNILKNILTGNTMSKFIIYKADPNKWKPVLARSIDSDQYPAFLGGDLRDPDGDPRYITKASRNTPKNILISRLYKFYRKIELRTDMLFT